jgi:hypothetical protein
MVHRPDPQCPRSRPASRAGRASSTEPGAGSAETNGLENGCAFNQTGPTYRPPLQPGFQRPSCGLPASRGTISRRREAGDSQSPSWRDDARPKTRIAPPGEHQTVKCPAFLRVRGSYKRKGARSADTLPAPTQSTTPSVTR